MFRSEQIFEEKLPQQIEKANNYRGSNCSLTTSNHSSSYSLDDRWELTCRVCVNRLMWMGAGRRGLRWLNFTWQTRKKGFEEFEDWGNDKIWFSFWNNHQHCAATMRQTNNCTNRWFLSHLNFGFDLWLFIFFFVCICWHFYHSESLHCNYIFSYFFSTKKQNKKQQKNYWITFRIYKFEDFFNWNFFSWKDFYSLIYS